jgi:O-antigen/teichoic acid export membrane protein
LRLTKNVLANFAGQTFSFLVGIGSLPLIIKYLGPDAYGLVGAFMTLMTWLALADIGMSTTLNREIARSLAGIRSAQSTGNLLRTVEIVFSVMVTAICGIIWMSSDWLASNWLLSDKLPTALVAEVITIIAFLAPLQCIEALYRGAFLGLQRHDVLNLVRVIISIVRWVGVVAVLELWSDDIRSFFLWQAFVSLLSIGLHAGLIYRYLPEVPSRRKFSLVEFKSIYLYSASILIHTFLTLLLTQIDKIILSGLISLEDFGYYMMAVTFAGVLSHLTFSITSAYFPRFSELVALNNMKSLVETYHMGAQLVTTLTMPLSMVLIFHGNSLLLVLGIDPNVADKVSPLMTLVVIGLTLNGLTHIPYVLSLAFGWTNYAIVTNSVSLVVLFPVLIWVVPRYGAEGAAWILITLNLFYLLVSMVFLHHRLLKTELWNWYRDDLLVPFFVTLVVVGMMKLVYPSDLKGSSQLFCVFVFTVTLYTLTLLSCNRLRGEVIRKVRRSWKIFT